MLGGQRAPSHTCSYMPGLGRPLNVFEKLFASYLGGFNGYVLKSGSSPLSRIPALFFSRLPTIESNDKKKLVQWTLTNN